MNKAKTITFSAIMTALGIVFGILEANFLNFNVLPGSKIGISNIVCLVVLYLFDFKTALAVNVSRTVFTGLLYSGLSSLLYSLPAAIISVFSMYIIKTICTDKVSCIGVSVAGAFFHNLCQVVVAMMISGSFNMIYYFSYLSFASVITGLFTGAIASAVINRIKKDLIR